MLSLFSVLAHGQMLQSIVNDQSVGSVTAPYAFQPLGSGVCSQIVAGATNACSVTAITTNGHLMIANCIIIGNSPQGSTLVSDSQSETWSDATDLSPNNGSSTGDSSVYAAIVANQNAADVITCSGGGTADGNIVFMSVVDIQSTSDRKSVV